MRFRFQQLQTINFKLATLFILLASCSVKPESTTDTESNKYKQYYIQGEKLYLKNCSNCHQQSGSGLGLLYPPLNQSDFMDKNFEQVICLIRNGKEGELVVNGKSFNKPMPGVATLTDLEIAEVATYIFNTWKHGRGLVEVQEASKILTACDSVSVSNNR